VQYYILEHVMMAQARPEELKSLTHSNVQRLVPEPFRNMGALQTSGFEICALMLAWTSPSSNYFRAQSF
jgi:hypothetical protein